MEKIIRNYGDSDIVGYLVLELLVKDQSVKRMVTLPLGPESSNITFKDLGDFAFDHYYKNYDSDSVYGFSYRIIEKD